MRCLLFSEFDNRLGPTGGRLAVCLGVVTKPSLTDSRHGNAQSFGQLSVADSVEELVCSLFEIHVCSVVDKPGLVNYSAYSRFGEVP